MSRTEARKPCAGCGRLVPQQGEYPYPHCAPDCPLATEWRKHENEHQRALDAAYARGVEAAAKVADAHLTCRPVSVNCIEIVRSEIRAIASTGKGERGTE